jgi:dolichol kinase
MSSFALQAEPVALDLYALLRELDPGRWRTETAAAAAAHLERLRVALSELVAALEARLQASSPDEELRSLRARLTEIEETVREQLAVSTAASREQWMALRSALLPRYEALRGVLDTEAVHVPALRPTNYRRSSMHAASGFVAFAVIALLPSAAWLTAVAGSFFVYAWAMELLRRRSPALNARIMRFYGPVAHPHEWHRVNSATWYCTALLALAMTGSPLVCSIAVLVLGVGDPAAALVGRRWGRTKLTNGRSLEGTLTFVVVGTLVAGSLCSLWYGDLGVGSVVALSAAGAVAGALAELFSRRVDDNLTIPIAAGAAAWSLSLAIL